MTKEVSDKTSSSFSDWKDRYALVCLTLVFFAAGCAYEDSALSGIQCESEQDCSGASVCVDGYCINESAGDAGDDATPDDDVGPVCSEPEERCGDDCVDTKTDTAHCGECDKSCAPGDVCDDGVCLPTCTGDELVCGTTCVDTQVDLDHCGDCDDPCSTDVTNAEALCDDGDCGYQCLPDFEPCTDDVCADTDTDTEHCGQCGNSCPTDALDADPTCDGGGCGYKCIADDFTLCPDAGPSGGDGACVDLEFDGDHCGECGIECLSGQCEDGECLPPTCDPQSQDTFGGGDGSAGDPFTICSPDQLQNMGSDTDYLDDHFTISDGIDLSGLTDTFEPIGSEQNPFNGTVDGYGLEISNLVIDESGSHIGLFAATGSDAVLEDFELVDVEVVGGLRIGALVGVNEGEILNVSISTADGAPVEGSFDRIGGVVGENYGVIERVSFAGDVVGESDLVGGLVGENAGEIVESKATGNITGENYVGGLVGSNSGDISTSFSTCEVSAGADYVGGLVGANTGTIEDSFAQGAITEDEGLYLGGLAGSNSGTIAQTYSTGQVDEDESAGGLIGDDNGSVSASYWDVETSGIADGGDASGEGLTTQDFVDEDSFNGWDFDNIWTMGNDDFGELRPRLGWEF